MSNNMMANLNIFTYLMIFMMWGMFTSSVQKFTILKVKDNVTISLGTFLLELSIAATGIVFFIQFNQTSNINTLISD